MNRIYLNMRLAIAQTQLPRQSVLKTLLGRYSYRLVWKGRRERAAGKINGSWVIFVQLFLLPCFIYARQARRKIH